LIADNKKAYASLLIEQGENIKYIQSQLGHSSPTMTLDVYAHLMKAVNQEAACRLEKQVFEINGDQNKKRGCTMRHNILKLLVRPAGFEPAAYGFEDQKSLFLESQ